MSKVYVKTQMRVLPKSCTSCSMARYRYGDTVFDSARYCDAKGYALKQYGGTYSKNRPKWCPLIVTEETIK